MQRTCEECEHWAMATLKCACDNSASYGRQRKRDDQACQHFTLSNR
jgi:hypothetical protein